MKNIIISYNPDIYIYIYTLLFSFSFLSQKLLVASSFFVCGSLKSVSYTQGQNDKPLPPKGQKKESNREMNEGEN